MLQVQSLLNSHDIIINTITVPGPGVYNLL